MSDRTYVEQNNSPTFPIIEKSDLYKFLKAALLNEVAAEINFRQWVRKQLGEQ